MWKLHRPRRKPEALPSVVKWATQVTLTLEPPALWREMKTAKKMTMEDRTILYSSLHRAVVNTIATVGVKASANHKDSVEFSVSIRAWSRVPGPGEGDADCKTVVPSQPKET